MTFHSGVGRKDAGHENRRETEGRRAFNVKGQTGMVTILTILIILFKQETAMPFPINSDIL